MALGAGLAGSLPLTPLGPPHPSQMWMSARQEGAASMGSVRTRMAGTPACAPTASCSTRPAAAASVSPRGLKLGPISSLPTGWSIPGSNSLRYPPPSPDSQVSPVTLRSLSGRLRLSYTPRLRGPSSAPLRMPQSFCILIPSDPQTFISSSQSPICPHLSPPPDLLQILRSFPDFFIHPHRLSSGPKPFSDLQTPQLFLRLSQSSPKYPSHPPNLPWDHPPPPTPLVPPPTPHPRTPNPVLKNFLSLSQPNM